MKIAAAVAPTGTTTITASLWKSGGSAESATFVITPTNLDHGDQVCRFRYEPKAQSEDRHDGLNGERSTHPTVKPTELMRWLCRLVTPPEGHVLDPFCGSGSTGRGAIAEGFQFTGIELDPEYAAIAEARTKVVQPGLPF